MRQIVFEHICYRILYAISGILMVPLSIALIAQEDVWHAYAIAISFSLIGAVVLSQSASGKKMPPLNHKEALLVVVLGWLILVTVTAVAYRLSGFFPSFSMAFFESMSGFTTTGATILEHIEKLPKSLLFMRSFSHCIGGVGIIVLSVAILPELAAGGLQLFAAESSGIQSEKLAPRISGTARRIWGFYIGITVAETIFLAFGNMSIFDAINHSMSTVATGGFSTKNASIGHYNSLYIELVILAFMFLSGISFALQCRVLISRRIRPLFNSIETRVYIFITLVAIALLTLNIYGTTPHYDTIGDSLRYASFQTVSIITTTGFTTTDFDVWPDASRFILLALMFLGGCSGSTAGGSKIIRTVVVIKHAVHSLRRMLRPNLVETIVINGRAIPRETTEGVLGFYALYFMATGIGSLILITLGLDLVSGTSAAISSMSSVGPGLGALGASESYSSVSSAGLYLLSAGMLLGRLELYTILVLFTSHFWRKG